MKKNLVPILVALALLISGTALGFGLKKNLQSTGAVAVQIQNYKPVTPSDGNVATSSEFVGSLVPSVNNAFNIGSTAASWRDIYASGTVRVSRNNATTTVLMATNTTSTLRGQGSCLILRDASTLNLQYLSIVNGALTVSSSTCE